MTDGTAPPPLVHVVAADRLYAREMEVLHLLSTLTYAQIGVRLGISEHTVKSYILRIARKLGVRNRADILAAVAPDEQSAPVERGLPALSARESTVLLLICHGLPASRIATRLGIAVDTAKGAVRRIREKWHVHSTPEVVELARRHGLV